MCYTYVGQYEEYGIYKAHRRDSKEGLIKLLCKDDCKASEEKTEL